jgi:hypothetical protein
VRESDQIREKLEAAIAAGSATVENMAELAQLHVKHSNLRAAAGLLPLLMTVPSDSPLLPPAIEKLKRLLVGGVLTETSPPGIALPLTVAPEHQAFVALQLVLAGLLREGEYVVVLEALCSPAQTAGLCAPTPQSTQHLLKKMGFADSGKVLTFLSRDSGMALLPLAQFQPQADAFSKLPAEYATVRGALAFDMLHEDLLVAVLNPYDCRLQMDVRKHWKRGAVFYLVAAPDYDATLNLMPRLP